jgi:hypothetical protein
LTGGKVRRTARRKIFRIAQVEDLGSVRAVQPRAAPHTLPGGGQGQPEPGLSRWRPRWREPAVPAKTGYAGSQDHFFITGEFTGSNGAHWWVGCGYDVDNGIKTYGAAFDQWVARSGGGCP